MSGEERFAGEALIVVIAGVRHAVPMDRVTEVRVHAGATRLPGAPAWIVGVVERNGRALELFGAARRLTGAEGRIDTRSCVLFVDDRVAMLVDEVERLAEGESLRGLPLLDLESFFDAREAS